jgi:hypothetical protein
LPQKLKRLKSLLSIVTEEEARMDPVAAAKVDFDSPDETRKPDKTDVAVVHTDNGSVARFVMQPGWTWESCVKPVVGGESCQVAHLGYVESGQIRIEPDDDEPMIFGPGDVYVLASGHTAEIIGDEQFVCYEFSSKAAQQYGTED